MSYLNPVRREGVYISTEEGRVISVAAKDNRIVT